MWPAELAAEQLMKFSRVAGGNAKPGRKARLDSLMKTLEYVSRW